MKTSYKRTFAQRWSSPRTNRSPVQKKQKSIKNNDKKAKEGNDKVIYRPGYMAFLKKITLISGLLFPQNANKTNKQKGNKSYLITHSCKSRKRSTKSIITTFWIKEKEGRTINQKSKRWLKETKDISDKAEHICLRDTRVLAYLARATTLFEAFINEIMRLYTYFSL